MIKGEILKNGQLYQFSYPNMGRDELVKAHKRLMGIAQGTEAFQGDTSIIDLGSSEEYGHIRVWYEEPQVEVAPPISRPPAGFPSWDTKRLQTNVLNRWYTLDLQTHTTADGHLYLLPMYLDDMPAVDFVSPKNLEAAVQFALEKAGVLASESYTILIPHAAIPDWDEARAYITDYIKAAGNNTPVKGNGNAKAWTGYHLDDKGGV